MKLKGIRFNDTSDGVAIAKLSRIIFNPLADTVIARVTPQGNLMGGVVFQNHTGAGGSIMLHVASVDRRWLNRDLLWAAFGYAFNQCGVRKIFCPVPASLPDVIQFCLNFGFKAETVLADAFPNGDMLILSMYREECRFLGLAPREVEV